MKVINLLGNIEPLKDGTIDGWDQSLLSWVSPMASIVDNQWCLLKWRRKGNPTIKLFYEIFMMLSKSSGLNSKLTMVELKYLVLDDVAVILPLVL